VSAAAAGTRVPTVSLPVVKSELACGARLCVSPRPGAPVTALQVHVRGGPSLDPAGREGTAFLAGSLADQGTERRTEEEIAAALEGAGGHLGGSATGLTANVVASEWKLLADVVCDVAMAPTYPAPRVRRHVGRLLDRLAIEARDPRVQAEQRFRKLVYGDHWMGRPAYGSAASLATIEARHLRSHHRRNWCARRALIAVCGDVDPERVRRDLDRRLAHWKPGEDLPLREPQLPGPGVRSDVFEVEREQVHVVLGHLGIRRRDPDYPALVVMDHVLGTGPGFANRISRRLRDELGLAYTVYASISSTAGLLPGTFQAYIGTSPRHVETAIAGFLREMRRIQEELVTVEELETARDYVVGSFVMGFQRAARRAGWIVSAERHGLAEDAIESLPRQFAAVTREDVRRVARAHLDPDRCCVSAAGPLRARDVDRILKRIGEA
jgi:zinc protease